MKRLKIRKTKSKFKILSAIHTNHVMMRKNTKSQSKIDHDTPHQNKRYREINDGIAQVKVYINQLTQPSEMINVINLIRFVCT